MSNNVISKFQMKLYKTHHFQFIAPLNASAPVNQLSHRFSGQYKFDFVDDKWLGIIMIRYSATNQAENDNDRLSLDIAANGLYEYRAENTDVNKEQFVKLLKMNGAAALLSIMRGQVAASTTSLGLNPCIIVPSVNLNHFDWAEIASK